MKHSKQTWLFLFGLFALAAFYRVVQMKYLPEFPNFSPLMAIAFCAGLLLPWRLALTAGFLPLLLSDLALNYLYEVPLLGGGEVLRWLCFGVALAVGVWLGRREWKLSSVVGATFGNAVFFYLISNSAAWLVSPAYAKTSSGWAQALTVGAPGFPPTWMFFRNSLVADFAFTALILAVYFVAVRRAASVDTSRAAVG